MDMQDIKGLIRSFASSTGIAPDMRRAPRRERVYGLNKFRLDPQWKVPGDERPPFSKCLFVKPVFDKQMKSEGNLFCLRISMDLKDLYHEPDNNVDLYHSSGGEKKMMTVAEDLNGSAVNSLMRKWESDIGLEEFIQEASGLGTVKQVGVNHTRYLMGNSQRISIALDMRDYSLAREPKDVIPSFPKPQGQGAGPQ